MRHDVGIRPQLLNPITELEALSLIESDAGTIAFYSNPESP